MDVSLLRWLRCPFCGGDLNASEMDQTHTGALRYGVLSCYCGRYPVVAGIPVLMKGATMTEAIDLIEGGRHQDALLALLSDRSVALQPKQTRSMPLVKWSRRLQRLASQRSLRRWRDQATALVSHQGKQTTACDFLDLYYDNQREFYNYFAFRFGQPSHLVALSFASIITKPKKPILDVACGAGHIIRSLIERANDQLVIGIDRTFLLLYVAKHWVARDAEYVCCAADALPFSNDAFSVVFCSDAFAVFVNKIIPIREFNRVTDNEGLLMLVRNALKPSPWTDNPPLPPEGYHALFAGVPHCLVASSEVLSGYLQKKGPSLGRSTDEGRLVHEREVSIVASHRQDVFQDYGLFEDWPHVSGRLTLNPLYRVQARDGDGKVCLRRSFPSVGYEKEHGECKRYLPESVEVDSEVLADLEAGKRTLAMENLIEQCILLGIPSGFGEDSDRALARHLPVRR